MNDILNIILGSLLAITILVLSYVVLFKMDDAGNMATLELSVESLTIERDSYKKLIDDGKEDCNIKIENARILWERNRDVKDDITHGDGSMVEFELGGVQ